MRGLFAVVALCAAFLVLTGVASAARQPHLGGAVRPGPAVNGPAARGAPDRGRFAPLGARLAASASVYGALYDSYHTPLGGKVVEWDSWSAADQQWYWDTVTTDAVSGAYSMSALATSNGEVWAYPDDDTLFARLGQSWSAGGSYNVDLYPGRIDVSATRGGPWHTFSRVDLTLWGPTAYTDDTITAGDTTSSPVSGAITALDGTYQTGSANFFYDEGMEFTTSAAVTSGAASPTTISLNEADAQRVWLTAPFWWSGKPGTTVRIVRNNFPAGWINYVTGYSDPKSTPFVKYGPRTSQGSATEPLSVKVPATAKPGYGYWIGFQHVDGSGDAQPLYVEEMFQVCTMKPSRAKVAKGAKIRITGIVPTQGHWGTTAGKRKPVVIWAHKGSTGVPTKWDPRSQGWRLVGSVRCNGLGAYTTPSFKVPATSTFVAQYGPDDWYWGAYTSTKKVTAR